MTKSRAVSAEMYRGRLRLALQAMMDRAEEPWTDTLLADATRQDPRTVKAHRLGQNGAQGHDLLSYMAVLDVGFAAEMLALAGLCGVRRAGEHFPVAAAVAEISEGLAELTRAMADGVIDHQEAPDVIRELEEAARAAEGLAAQLRRQFGLGG